MRDKSAFGLVHQLVDLVVGPFGAVHKPAVARIHIAVVEPDPRAVLDSLEYVGAGLVDQGDAVVDQHFGAQIRVPAGDRGRRVDHSGDLGFDEGVGGDAVEVKCIDHHDVPRSDAAQQTVDVAVHTGG